MTRSRTRGIGSQPPTNVTRKDQKRRGSITWCASSAKICSCAVKIEDGEDTQDHLIPWGVRGMEGPSVAPLEGTEARKKGNEDVDRWDASSLK